MIFDKVLETFNEEDIKKFAKQCIELAPEYWHHVPASSTGKYHPPYSLGDGGLVRHSIAVVKFLNYFLEVESINNQFTKREQNLMRVAAIVHDMWKSGEQDEYEKSKWTRFDHPLIAAQHIRNMEGLDEKEREFIAHCVESHMGQWNVDKRNPNIKLPKPQDKYQILLHLADYLASRKEVEMKFEETSAPKPAEPEPLPDVNTWKINFGKYKGMTLKEIEEVDPKYIAWMQNKEGFSAEPCKSLLIQMGYNFAG